MPILWEDGNPESTHTMHRVSPSEVVFKPHAHAPIAEPFAGANEALRLAMLQALREGIERIVKRGQPQHRPGAHGLVQELRETLAMAEALSEHLREMDI